jgi:hypothetical protein
MLLPPRATSAELGAKPQSTSRTAPYDAGVRTVFFAYLLFVLAGIVFYSVVGALHY